MKAGMLILASVLMVGGMVGCSKTMTELKMNGDAIVDNGTSFINQTVITVGGSGEEGVEYGVCSV